MALGSLALVTLDCPDPVGLANFYQSILGGTVDDTAAADHGWVQLNTPAGTNVGFQRSESFRPPDWPSGDQQTQAHLDIAPTNYDAAVEAVVALGARRADDQPSTEHWIVFFDPAGHPFCLIRHP